MLRIRCAGGAKCWNARKISAHCFFTDDFVHLEYFRADTIAAQRATGSPCATIWSCRVCIYPSVASVGSKRSCKSLPVASSMNTSSVHRSARPSNGCPDKSFSYQSCRAVNLHQFAKPGAAFSHGVHANGRAFPGLPKLRCNHDLADAFNR